MEDKLNKLLLQRQQIVTSVLSECGISIEAAMKLLNNLDMLIKEFANMYINEKLN